MGLHLQFFFMEDVSRAELHVDGQWRLWWYCVDTQVSLSLHCSHMQLTHYFTWLFKSRLLYNHQTNNFNNLDNCNIDIDKELKILQWKVKLLVWAIWPFAAMFSKVMFNGRCQMSSVKYLFIYWGFTPLSKLFQLYHGDSSLIHDPWVNKPVLGKKMCLAQGHSTMTVVPCVK